MKQTEIFVDVKNNVVFVDVGILKPKCQNITSIEMKQNEIFVDAKIKVVFVDIVILKPKRKNI